VAGLRASLERTDLTVLVAPAGYGKTSLLSLALSEDPLCAWYTAQLWHAGEFAEPLVREVRRVRPDFGRLTLALASRRPLAGPGASQAAWAQRLGATFAEELAHVDAPMRVVCDDVHCLDDDPAFGAFVTGLMRTLPPGVSLILAGRALPEMPLAEWIAQERARVIGADLLRFDRADVLELARRRHVEVADPGALLAAFEGWAAGIALSVAGADVAVPTRHGATNASTALLLDTNLAQLDAQMVAFLERTAVFETLHASLLERDATLGDVRRSLREFERRGVMLSVVKPAEVYRVHPLLREALVERVRARSGARAVDGAHLWAGELLERAGADLPALFHFEQSRDDQRLARFVQEHAYALFIAGLGGRAGRIVRGLRQRGVHAPIAYGLVEGMLLRQRGEAGAATLLREGIEAARSAGDIAAEITLRSVLIEDRLAQRERPERAEIEQLLRMAHGAGAQQAEVTGHTFAGWAYVLDGDFRAARASARAAFSLADDLVSRVRVVALDAYAATALGEIEDADRMMSETLRALESSDHIVLMANTLVWYARLALLWGDYGAARDYAEKGRELAQRLELPAELAGVELALAEIYAHDGPPGACEDAATAAGSAGASAWYAGDRERSRALAGLFVARAAFRETGGATALEAILRALDETAPPSAQRISMLAEGAAYARIAKNPQHESLAAQAEALLSSATAVDALDALGISLSHAILRELRSLSKEPVDSLPAVSPRIASTYAGLLKRRDDLTLRQPARARAVERFETRLRNALEPAQPPAAPASLVEPRASALTKRETEILEFLAEGLTNKEIAQRFSLSPRTVDSHVERVLSKLAATTRTRAVAAAIRAGLISPS
jgi:LuxR family maltose regulon positive regulatory protein